MDFATNTIESKVDRSFLFIPADREDFVKKGHLRGADVIILDLEDSIPKDKKLQARNSVNAALKQLRQYQQKTAVRVNSDLSGLVKDIESISLDLVDYIVVPKVEHGASLTAIDTLLSELELEQKQPIGKVKLLAIIESALGVKSLDDIVRASPRLSVISLGSEDLAADLGCEPCEESLLGICQAMVLSTRNTGVMALGFPGSIGEFNDLTKLEHQIDKANKMGLEGALCIHPNQVKVVNQGFGYSAKQVSWAKKVVEKMEQAQKIGLAVCNVDGQMIDEPVLKRAKSILASQ